MQSMCKLGGWVILVRTRERAMPSSTAIAAPVMVEVGCMLRGWKRMGLTLGHVGEHDVGSVAENNETVGCPA